MDCSNYGRQDIIMPVKVTWLKELLEQSSYDKQLTNQLIQGFTHGFDISYQGSLTKLWNKVKKEVQLKRYAGPYEFNQLPT